MDTSDLLKQFGVVSDVYNVDGTIEATTDRAATSFMSRPQEVFGFRQPGLGPVDQGAGFGAMGFQAPSKGQIRFDLGPAQKAQPSGGFAQMPNIQIAEMPMEMEPEEAEPMMGMPALLSSPMLMFDDDDTNQEMLCEEPLEDGALPRLEPFDYGTKTSLVSSRNPEDVLAAVRTAIFILGSAGSEITHQVEGWQVRVEYIYKNSHTSVSINLLETNEKEVAISFVRVSGYGWVFQRFYRQCVAGLQNELPDVRRGDGSGALPTVEAIEDTFDCSGITIDEKTVHQALENTLQLASSHHNATLEPKREATSAMVQLIQSHTENCLTFAATTKSSFTHIMTTLMKECSGDPEVMRNCVRAFSILMEGGKNFDNKTRLYQLLHVTPAFAIVAECIAKALSGTDSPASASMVCNDLCAFLTHLVQDFYSQGAKPSALALSALRGVVDTKCVEEHRAIHDQCYKLMTLIC